MDYEQAKQKFIKHIDSLEGRDLMYFLILDCMDDSQADPDFKYILQKIDGGDAITDFMTDHICDRSARNFLKERINDIWSKNME